MNRYGALLTAGALLACVLAPGPLAAWKCPGDCDADGAVTVDELLRAVAVALGERELIWCAAADRDGSGVVTVDEILVAVQMALQGCPQRGFQHGMNLASWWRGQLADPALGEALDQLAETSVDTVIIVPTWYMEAATSSEVVEDPWKTSSLAEIETALAEARRRGFRTALKPHVDVRDGEWRGRIQPEDVDAWFASYTGIVGALADIANASGSELFVIATELQSLTGAAHRAHWEAVFAAVRARYSGEVAYAANWDGYATKGIWDLVDVVGIDAYFPLSAAADPTREEILTAWRGDEATERPGWMKEIRSWFDATFPQGDKRLVFTEVGYLSTDFALSQPWEIEEECFAASGTRAYNEALQARAYAALLDVSSALDGIFWWHWEPYPITHAAGQCTYSPQGKAAESILRARADRGR